MSAIELKKLLIQRIAEIDDVSFLKAIKTILDTKKASKAIILTQEQREAINASKKDVEKGFIIEQAELDNEFDKWLSVK
ncbi:MAG: hypothetical protein U9Q98_07890 [Bacteroidota bacterium]|nr:hypothetical protein [Bacteroidota bacterium]